MHATRLSSLGKDDRTNRQIALLLAIGFLGLVGAVVAAFWVQRSNQNTSALVAHTLDIQARINAFASANERAETARRGYLLSPRDSFRERMHSAQQERSQLLAQIEEATADNPTQQERIQALTQVLAELEALQDQSVTGIVGVRERDAASFGEDRAVELTRQVRDAARGMLVEEQQLLTRRQAKQQATVLRFNVLLVLTAALVVALSATTLVLIRRNLADLRTSRNDLNRLNLALEDLVDLRTEALRRANAEIQRFAYIVSHDLRSPLVNVMGFTSELESARSTIAGFAERLETEAPHLLDQPTRLAIREDLPEAIGFIRSSTHKMDRLIKSILKLSREGQRTLAPEPVDIGALVGGIADTMRHRAIETGTRIEVGELPQVVTDRMSLEQILSNLIDNALKYLRPGVPGLIRVSGELRRGRILLSVADNGRGIAQRDHQRVFELFRRGGTQDQPGEGIGLAHVRALAHRLGGTIEVESTPGEGSTFCLSLPLEWRPGESHA